MTCPEAGPALGAYVLDALEPDERRAMDDHVRSCPVCAAELAEFERLPALLDRVRPEDLEPVSVTPSPDLFDRVAAVAGTRRSGRSRRWGLVAAVMLLVLGLGAGAAIWASRTGERTVTATSGPVEVTVTAISANDGSALDVTVAGMRPGERCVLVAVDRDGEKHPAGDWPVSDAGDGRWRGWAAVEPDDLAEMIVLGEGGREVVRVPL